MIHLLPFRLSSRRSVLASSVVVVCALLLVGFLGCLEPWYHGKSLSQWFRQLYQPERGVEEAQHAIHEIGPKAVPFLLQKLKDNEELREKNNLLLRIHRAAWQKLPAVLQHLFPKPKSWDASFYLRVRWALRLIGPTAVPKLIEAFNDPDLVVRSFAVETVGALGADPELTVPPLVRMLHDPTAAIRLKSVLALGEVATNSKRVIPALIAALRDTDTGPTSTNTAYVRESAAEVLGTIGSEARLAVPDLTALLAYTNSYTRQQAAIALWRINGDTNAIPVLISELPQAFDAARCASIVTILGDIGPAAAAAVPAIRRVITNWFGIRENIPRLGLEALKKIDPEASARAEADLRILQLWAKVAHWPDKEARLRQLSDEIRNTLTSTNSYSREQAIRALWRIEPKAELVSRAVAELEHAPDALMCRRLLDLLAEMGPEAQLATPAILRAITNSIRLPNPSGVDLPGAGRAALLRIDPEAAAKLDSQAK
jgi:HEAT repeat protein